MSLYTTNRSDGSLSFYIDGNLQFDSRDEALYHESLVLPALSLASEPKNVLICGGGDGLALREILRYPGVESVRLIDCSPDVIELARTTFADQNGHSLEDPRATVEIADALTVEYESERYDVIVCDFTFPTTVEASAVFTLEWYQKLRKALAPGGVLAINAVSPQNSPLAFASIVKTLRAANLHPLPLHVCIPSFRDHGYGAWGFVFASKKRLTIEGLRNIDCPVPTEQADLSKLWRGARFRQFARQQFRDAPVNTADAPVLHTLLLNQERYDRTLAVEEPPGFPELMEAVEVLHPYHSRSMIETLAEQVAGSIKGVDLRKLVEELSKRAAELPTKLKIELQKLKEFLSRNVIDIDSWGKWACQLFAVLVLVMTIANSLSPDNAFAKGAEGLGHASFSRGFSGQEMSMGRSGPISSAYGSSGGATTSSLSGHGFRSSYGNDPVDIYGNSYHPRAYGYSYYDPYPWGYGGYYHYHYYSSYGYSNSGRQPQNIPSKLQPVTHRPLYVLDDDLMMMDNGDVIVTLSDEAYLLVRQGTISLISKNQAGALMPIYPEPKLFASILEEIDGQTIDLNGEIGRRKDWLSWVGWTQSLVPAVKADASELSNIEDLHKKLVLAKANLGSTKASVSLELPAGAMELFVGCFLLPDGRISIHDPDNKELITDGTNVTLPDGKTEKIAPELKSLLLSVMRKLDDELSKDNASYDKQFAALDQDEKSANQDLAEYRSIQTQNPMDPDYEVDYGTDSVPVGTAISRTQSDLSDIKAQRDQLQTERDKDTKDKATLDNGLRRWGA